MTNHIWHKDQILHVRWEELTTYEFGNTYTSEKEICLQIWRDKSGSRGFSFYLEYPDGGMQWVGLGDGIYNKPGEEIGIFKNLYLKDDDTVLSIAIKFLKAYVIAYRIICYNHVITQSKLLCASFIDKPADYLMLSGMPPKEKDSIYFSYYRRRSASPGPEGGAEPGSCDQMFTEIDRYHETKVISFILKMYIKKERLTNPEFSGASDEIVIEYLDGT